MSNLRLKDKVAIVNGSRASAQLFAAEGVTVLVTGRKRTQQGRRAWSHSQS